MKDKEILTVCNSLAHETLMWCSWGYQRRECAIPGTCSTVLNHKTMGILLLNKILLLNNTFVFFSCVIAIIPSLFWINALSICDPSWKAFIPLQHCRDKESAEIIGKWKNYYFFCIRELSILGQWDIGGFMRVLLSFEEEWALLMLSWVRYRIFTFSFWMGWVSHTYNGLGAVWQHFQKQNYFVCVYQDGWKQMQVFLPAVLASWKFWCGS